MPDPPDPGSNWIPSAEYEQIEAKVPILCVDMLPLDPAGGAVGLIRRETYDGNEGWCMIGGAVLRNEGLVQAIARHVRSTLGEGFRFELSPAEPLTVAEYFPDPGPGRLHDPRKHAVALTYVGTCDGTPRAQGEALEFRWFPREELSGVQLGFDQGVVVDRLLERVG